MRSSVRLCNIEGCNNPVWSKGVCKNHTPKKPMKNSRDLNIYISESGKEQFEKALKSHLMHEFFLKIWKERPHRSEISNTYLGKEALSIYFHHILAKEKYPEAKLDEENIILLTLDEHTNVENDMYKYEKINKIRNQLKLKYGIL